MNEISFIEGFVLLVISTEDVDQKATYNLIVYVFRKGEQAFLELFTSLFLTEVLVEEVDQGFNHNWLMSLSSWIVS